MKVVDTGFSGSCAGGSGGGKVPKSSQPAVVISIAESMIITINGI
jgi:hypothetical protein